MMTDMVHDMNSELARQQNMTDDQIEDMKKQITPQLDHVNGMLFDLLKTNGVIP